MPDWISLARSAAEAAQAYSQAAWQSVARIVAPSGKLDAALADREQRLVHGFAWIGTTVAALAATADWAARSLAAGRFGERGKITDGANVFHITWQF